MRITGDTMTGALLVSGASVTADSFNAAPANGSFKIAGTTTLSVGTGQEAGNLFIGKLSGSSITSGSADTLVGYQVGRQLTTGYQNTASGYSAFGNNTTGHDNTISGYFAMLNSSSASFNTAIGSAAGRNITDGLGNITIGYEAGLSITTSYDNTIIGTQANATASSRNSVAIGQLASVNASSAVQLGSGINSTNNSLQFNGVNFLSDAGYLSVSSALVSGNATIAQPGLSSQLVLKRLSNAQGSMTFGIQGDRTNDSMAGGTFDELNIRDSGGNIFFSIDSGFTAFGPGIFFGSGVDATITRPSINKLSFNTASAQNMTLDGSGHLNLPALTASRVVLTDGSKNLVSSAVTSTELGYLTGLTGNVQAQLNAGGGGGPFVLLAGDTMTGALITPELHANVLNVASGSVGIGTASPLHIFDVSPAADHHFMVQSPVLLADGVVVSSTDDAESVNLGVEIRGVPIQLTTTGGPTSPIIMSPNQVEIARVDGTGLKINTTASRVVVSSAANYLESSGITTTELDYLSGLGSNVQTQLNTLSTSLNDKADRTGDILTGALVDTASTASLTADNQNVSISNVQLMILSSDNATPTSRTFTLGSAQDGLHITLVWDSSNAGELIDNSTITGGGTLRLNGDWVPTANDTLSLVCRFGSALDCYETARSAN